MPDQWQTRHIIVPSGSDDCVRVCLFPLTRPVEKVGRPGSRWRSLRVRIRPSNSSSLLTY